LRRLLLREKISQYITPLDGNARKLNKEIMNISKEIYKKNFKAGFDVERFRWGMIFLGGLVGTIAGGLAGWALDELGNKYWRREEEY